MNRSGSLAAFADTLAPPRGSPGSVERFRGRAMAVTLLLSGSAAVTTAPVYWFTGLWVTALITTFFGLLTLGLFRAFRAGMNTLRTYFWLLGLTSVLMVLCSAIETPLDSTALVWTLIFPVSGYLLAGSKAGGWGALIALVSTVMSVMLHRLGWVAHVQPPVTSLAMGVRFTSLFGGVTLMTATSEVLRMQAMTEAERSSQAKSLFLANMSHELRTPMNGVLGLTDLVLQGPLEAHQREQLELVKRSGQSLVGIIDNILHLTKIESAGVRLEALPVDLRRLVDDVVALHQPAASNKGLSLSAQIAPNVPELINGDPTRLTQIVNNLVGNALKFTSAGSVAVSVSTRRAEAGEWVELAVKDTGIGIPVSAQGQLFKSFQQLDETFTRRFGGTGLGLAISRQLAVAMGGDITVESSEGQGSTFTVSLPLVAVQVSQKRPEGVAPAATVKTFAHSQWPVLIVDDNAINLRVAKGFVERLGLKVELAGNGLEAVAKASANTFLFVLMDCHMPELDGFEATRRIRALPSAHATVPIVAVTASVMAEDVEACLASGMNYVLPKPLKLGELNDLVQRLRSEHPAVD